MNITRNEAIEGHKKLWSKVAEVLREYGKMFNIYIKAPEEAYKEVALDEIREDRILMNNCYCCEYTKGYCHVCPLAWNKNKSTYICPCCKGEFGDFHETLDKLYKTQDPEEEKEYLEKAIKIANQIANLPVITTELRFKIEWAKRDMLIDVRESDFDKTMKIIDKAYSRWCDVEENPDLQYECCEEYIHSQLDENGIHFIDKGSVYWEGDEE